jgi:vacuolar-type H+-ATPase subunit C/Vma6
MSALYQYSAPYCRLKAMKAKLLNRAQMARLLSTPDAEAMQSLLLETDYAEALSQNPPSSLGEQEHRLKEHTIRCCEKLLRFLKGDAAEFVQLLLQYFDLLNAKIVVRKLHSLQPGLMEKDVSPLLFDTGRWGWSEKLAWTAISNFAALSRALPGTFLFDSFQAALEHYKTDEDLFAFESALDLCYLHHLYGKGEALSGMDRRHCGEILKPYRNLHNTIWFIRLKFLRGIESRRIFHSLIALNGDFDEAPFAEALSASSEKEAYEHLVRALFPKYRSLLNLDPFSLRAAELALKRYLLENCQKLFRTFPFHLGLFVAYYFIKRSEVEDIIAILEGKQLGLSEKRIAQQLISEV